jgi:hypothetical protein
MKRQLLASLALMSSLAFPSALKAEPTKGYYTMDALGCMIVQECTDGVVQVWGADHLEELFPNSDWNLVKEEFARIMNALSQVGVSVYIAPEKYFPVGHRGVYHTVSNNFYLNRTYVHRPHVMMTVMRHEGWHAAQDCMAGTIKNSMIAIIKPEEAVPPVWREMVERSYPKSAVPWEAEATWAGKSADMTQEALEACAEGSMWEKYPPTPMTKAWLKENGYITK